MLFRVATVMTYFYMYLEQWVSMLKEPADCSMSSLMISHCLLLCGLQDLCLFLKTWTKSAQNVLSIDTGEKTPPKNIVLKMFYRPSQGWFVPAQSMEKTIRETAYKGCWFHDSPPITLSMACSKCLVLTAPLRCLAAIRAASLHTLAMSAPERREQKHTVIIYTESVSLLTIYFYYNYWYSLIDEHFKCLPGLW